MASKRSTGWQAAMIIAMLVTDAAAQELPPLEAYGALPYTSLVTLSPDGSQVASRIKSGGLDAIYVKTLADSSFVAGGDATGINPRRLWFANNENLVLVASKTHKDAFMRRAFNYSSVYALNLKDQEIRVLLRKAKDLYQYQSGLGGIVGRSPDGNTLYMPAYYDTGANPIYSLFAVRLDRPSERRMARGNRHTRDWFVDQDGRAMVRVDFDDDKNVHRIWRMGTGKTENTLLYEEKVNRPRIIPVGISADGNSLVVLASSRKSDANLYFLMNLETGELSEQVLTRDDAEIARIITDINRVVYGVQYSGFFPSYYFFDKALHDRVESIRLRLPGVSASLQAWSDDFEKLVFRVSGGWSSGHYLLFDGDNPKPVSVGRQRPAIDSMHVARVYIDAYAARDGLTIPALITARPDVYENGNAPLIVMPHGGPESHDTAGFDWLTQYFASRGYVLLQPQFRGSSGFGWSFSNAGLGEWGGKMQTDLDDGVQYLIDAGIADPDRVCMVGASYGGYAALAAGAFSPDIYKCIVSIAGVSDLRSMLKAERSSRGRNNWVVDYWSDQFGGGVKEKELLNAISPLHHAARFVAPVLLIHGKKDTVVPIRQSKRMYRALTDMRKQVEFVQLDGEDHWLSKANTRLETLRVVAEFIDKHL
jgi:dipeptidyl aminopeptidase/acylaminoacyl peptidase